MQCHYSECHYAKCHYAECHYAECHCAECRQADRRGTHLNSSKNVFKFKIIQYLRLNETKLTSMQHF